MYKLYFPRHFLFLLSSSHTWPLGPGHIDAVLTNCVLTNCVLTALSLRSTLFLRASLAVMATSQKSTTEKTKKQKKNQLTITKQPPHEFANQEGGKRHGFVVAVKMHNPRESSILKVELLYADNGKRVPDTSHKRRQPHQTLQVLKPAKEFNKAGETEILARINDVSRNHRGRAFCLQLSVVHQGLIIASVATRPIKVISKQPKKKKAKAKRRRASERKHASSALPKQKRTCTVPPIASLGADWCNRAPWHEVAYKLLKTLQHYKLGSCPSQNMAQCPSCSSIGFRHNFKHYPNCDLAGLLRDFGKPNPKSVSSESAECTPPTEEEPKDEGMEEFEGCSARALTEEFEKQCEARLLPSAHCGSDVEEAVNLVNA